jgi:hypothetical protein
MKTMSSILSISSYKVCDDCVINVNTSRNYYQAMNVIANYLKIYQQPTDPELASPEIKIEPADTLIQQAVNLLKKINPNYFIGVRKIVVDTGGNSYGHVASGPQDDPTVIHINLPKIKSEIQSKLGNLSKEDQEKELIRQIALIVSHEKGHTFSFKPEIGFQGGEQPAEAEATSIGNTLKNV